MRNQFVKMPMGLPWFALLLTLQLGAAAADKPESKPGASLEPGTTLSTTAAPTPFGGCCKTPGDSCGACDDLDTTEWCSYSRDNCEGCGAGATWCGAGDEAPHAPEPAPAPTPASQPGQELGFVGCCFYSTGADTCGSCATTIDETNECFWNRANCEGCAGHATWCGDADVMPWAPTTAPTPGAALASAGGGDGNGGGSGVPDAAAAGAGAGAAALLIAAAAVYFAKRRKQQPKTPPATHDIETPQQRRDWSQDPPFRRSEDPGSFRGNERTFSWGANNQGLVQWHGHDAFVYHADYDAGSALRSASDPLKVLKPSDAVCRALQSQLTHHERLDAFRNACNSLRVPWTTGKVEFTVSRKHALYDAFNSLGALSDEQWRQPFFVKFRGEAGLDAGGLSREFFQLASSQLVAPDLGLFRPTSDGTYDLVEDKDAATAHDKNPAPWFTFAGQLLGKALLEGHHLSTLFHLNRLLLKYVATEPIELDDLELADPELHQNMSQLHNMSRETVADLMLTFSVDHVAFGETTTRDLVENGRDVSVTGDNVDDFLAARLRDRVFDGRRGSLDAFLQGVFSVVPREVLLLLSARELELVLFGAPDIDVDEWRRSTVYRGSLEESSDVVEMFWAEVEAWPVEKRARLLQWCTGSTRVPVGGFDQLLGRDGAVKRFTLTSVSLDQAVYPRAHTCFNRIDLPLFADRRTLAEAFDVALRTDEYTMD